MSKHIWKVIPAIALFGFGLIAYSGYHRAANQYQAEINELLIQNELLMADYEKHLEEIAALSDKVTESGNADKTGENKTFQHQGLVEIRELNSTIEADLKYATADNFTGEVLYQLGVCLLLRSTAEKLVAANSEFAEKGYRLKIWDAYRPKSAQHIMWELSPDGVYVADPAVGSNHNRGTSVDVTLIDQSGNEVVMPTSFDDFTEKASRNYPGMSEEARANMDYLTDVMVRNGFSIIQSEWWHFNDADYKDYPHLDLTLEEWVNQYFDSL